MTGSLRTDARAAYKQAEWEASCRLWQRVVSEESVDDESVGKYVRSLRAAADFDRLNDFAMALCGSGEAYAEHVRFALLALLKADRYREAAALALRSAAFGEIVDEQTALSGLRALWAEGDRTGRLAFLARVQRPVRFSESVARLALRILADSLDHALSLIEAGDADAAHAFVAAIPFEGPELPTLRKRSVSLWTTFADLGLLPPDNFIAFSRTLFEPDRIASIVANYAAAALKRKRLPADELARKLGARFQPAELERTLQELGAANLASATAAIDPLPEHDAVNGKASEAIAGPVLQAGSTAEVFDALKTARAQIGGSQDPAADEDAISGLRKLTRTHLAQLTELGRQLDDAENWSESVELWACLVAFSLRVASLRRLCRAAFLADRVPVLAEVGWDWLTPADLRTFSVFELGVLILAAARDDSATRRRRTWDLLAHHDVVKERRWAELAKRWREPEHLLVVMGFVAEYADHAATAGTSAPSSATPAQAAMLAALGEDGAALEELAQSEAPEILAVPATMGRLMAQGMLRHSPFTSRLALALTGGGRGGAQSSAVDDLRAKLTSARERLAALKIEHREVKDRLKESVEALRLEQRLKKAWGTKPAAEAEGAVPAPEAAAPETVSVSWITMADNRGWAYGNNAKRLAQRLPEFTHVDDDPTARSSIAVYFDIKIYQRVGRLSETNILRVGGMRPIALSYGQDMEKFREDLAAFDAVIVTNKALFDLIAPLHAHVSLVPNGIDLQAWAPADSRKRRKFTVGFSGNLSTRNEREIKGYDLAEKACRQLGVTLLAARKGKGQIAHEDMLDGFYRRIDCLVLPVGAGKEGSSNSIMEALAAGVPVITTRDAGFHGELLTDGKDVLFCERDVDAIAAAITRLKNDPALRARMISDGRSFAERHHDIDQIAAAYRKIFLAAHRRSERLDLCFVPFWEPVDKFASSRLRCRYPSELLAGSALLRPSLGYSDQCDAVVVSQLASDEVYDALMKNSRQFLVYDVCDRYFLDERTIGGVHARERFEQLAARADVITVPTARLKAAIGALDLHKPVVVVPDGIDYAEQLDPSRTPADGPVVWFGNFGRGNFESARWLLDFARTELGRDIRIISTKKKFNAFPEYRAAAVEWSPETFVRDLRTGSVAIISHHGDEGTKSPNRLVAAIANGLPCIVSNSPSSADLLYEAGLDYAVVEDEKGLRRAVGLLKKKAQRRAYLEKAQAVVRRHFEPERVRAGYERLFATLHHVRDVQAPLRILFVSHNLKRGEGAPTSLLQLIRGLMRTYDVKPVVYCPLGGDLAQEYSDAGIELVVSHENSRHRSITQLLRKEPTQIYAAFERLIAEGKFDLAVFNTAKLLPLADMVEQMGVPVVSIIRESSEDHLSLEFARGPARDASERALRNAAATIFVGTATEALWKRLRGVERSTTIPNGIEVGPWQSYRQLPVDEARAQLGVAADEMLVVSVGTISARKSQIDLVHAFAKLGDDIRPRARLALVGARENEYLDGFKAEMAQIDPAVAERILVVPETDAVALWYRAADLFVLASRNESYPRVLPEAMYFGLPVISSDVFGAAEQVLDGQNGFLFEPGNVDQLAHFLGMLIGDEALRRRFGERSEVRFSELISYDEMVHRYFAIFKAIRLSSSVRTPLLEYELTKG